MTEFLIIGGFGLLLLLVSVTLGDFFDFDLGDFGGDLFSMAGIGGFVGTLGFVGALVENGTGTTWLAWAVGVAAGLAVGLLVGWLTRLMRRSEHSGTVKTESLIGLTGTVVSAIPSGGYGEVSVVAGGHMLKLNAKSLTAVPQGARVWVVNTLSATAVEVAPVDQIDS